MASYSDPKGPEVLCGTVLNWVIGRLTNAIHLVASGTRTSDENQ